MNKIRTLTEREIECRINKINSNGLQLLLYNDARCDMAILDETFGEMNWQRHHTRDNANCIVSIWDETKQCWIEKEDTGTESNTEAQKGLASDSFKRACVNVGIGRELYTAPFIWVTPPNCKIVDNGGRFNCNDRFEVKEIGYNEHREINRLVIVNSKTGNVVYEYRTRTKYPESTSKPSSGTLEDMNAANKHADGAAVIEQPKCECCGTFITGVALPSGETMTASELIGKSKLNYNGVFCMNCMKELNRKRKEK